MNKTILKVSAHKKKFKMAVRPRELTAVFLEEENKILDPDVDDYAIMLFNCPCPTDAESLKEIKKQLQQKLESMDLEQIKQYLEANRKESA